MSSKTNGPAILPVILAGGSGSRLWPLSRRYYAKQYIALDGASTMLQATLARLDGIHTAPPIVICNDETRFLAAEQIRQMRLKPATILLEPIGRNTAPAIALAALQATYDGSDPIMLVMPSDHKIADNVGFEDAVGKAVTLADGGMLVTFGITPPTPETGYGYIRKGASITGSHGFEIDAFVEKPDLETAKEYLASGEYLWNGGMFAIKASRYLEELAMHCPDVLAACTAAFNARQEDLDFLRVGTAEFEVCPDISIDYGVMEHTNSGAVVPLNVGWNDIGSWAAIWDTQEKDDGGNYCVGDVINIDGQNNYLHSESRLVATVGLENHVVVETKDAVMVAPKDRVQDVKKIVNEIKRLERSEHEYHREVYRPWGKYDGVDMGERYQVKRITVNPGAKLSVQMHHHRAEHWVVVRGTAKVTKGEETILLSENESTYIPVGTIHALENPGQIPLELIEVQSGSYLGEDDIVRLEDRYGRQ